MARTAIILILAAGFAVGARACLPPDCENVDCGSCGNACCKLKIYITSTPAGTPPRPVDVMTALNETLGHGGPDSRYSLPPLAGGGFGFSDLRPYNLTGVSFIGQSYHLTAKRTYTDTQDWTIGPATYKGLTGVVIKAFSISQIGGAYCDAGQNYKNLYQVAYLGLMNTVVSRQMLWHYAVEHVDDSCPAPK